MRDVLGDALRPAVEIGVAERRGCPGAALIEEHDAVVRERTVEPAGRRRRVEGGRRLEPRAALQEQQVGQALAALACHDGGVHVDRARVGVVTPDERHGEGVVVDREVEQAAGGDSHPSSLGTADPRVSRSGR